MKSSQVDHILLFLAVALMGFGLIVVYSASSVASVATLSDGLYYFKRQLLWVFLGLMGMFVFSYIPYYKLERLSAWLLGLSLFFLVIVLIPGFSHDIGGARRWLRFGGIGFQPSELAKICFIMYMAHSISAKQEKIKSFVRGLLPDLAVTIILFLLIFKEPNLSTASLVLATYIILYFLAGGALYNISALGIAGFISVFALIFTADYRIKRLTAFLNPWENQQNSGYHIIQSLVAIGSGGIWGLGLGQSRQKFFILPERHTDFIFAIICEELGMIGAIAVLLTFFALVWRGFKIALKAPDNFGFLLASGITTLIGLQVAINIGVVFSLVPTTGITLPFISYGGSSLVFLAIGIGILLNISKYGSSKNLIQNRAAPFSGQFSEPRVSDLRRRR